MTFQDNPFRISRDTGEEVPFFQVKCSSLLTDSKKTYTICSACSESAICEVAAISVERKPRYRRKGTLPPEWGSLPYWPIATKLTSFASACVVSATNGVPGKSQIQTRRYNVLQVKYSLLTDLNDIYTVCATFLEMAPCSTSSVETHERYFALQV